MSDGWVWLGCCFHCFCFSTISCTARLINHMASVAVAFSSNRKVMHLSQRCVAIYIHCTTPHRKSNLDLLGLGGEKGNKLLSSTAMSPLSGIGLSEMELVSSLMIYYRLSTILLDRLDCMWTLLEIIHVLGLGAGLKNLILNPISLSPFISHIVCCYHLQANASTSLCDA